MATPDDLQRIGVALNERQLGRVRRLKTDLDIPAARFFAACADVLTDEEVIEIMRRFSVIKGADHAAAIEARYQVKKAGVSTTG